MEKVKKYLNRIFIDGLSGMALGLFATLIIGTIIEQVGSLLPGTVGSYIKFFGSVAKYMTGAGIGVGVAGKFKSSPLVTVSAATAGMVGAYASKILAGSFLVSAGELVWAESGSAAGAMVVLSGFGEPLGAFIAAYAAIELGSLVSGKTKVDIIVTPLVSILTGSVVGLLVGPSISRFMTWLGSIVNYNVEQNPVLGGIIVSVLMGMILTLPISSAAIGISLNLTGLAAGAATIGCCANMVGFAVASYRENKVGGLIAQGIGTSMLQVPNIVKKPVIWLPAMITSAVLGPIGTTLIVMTNNAVGSGMGTAGLVGQIMTYQVMAPQEGAVITLVKIAVMHVVLPAALSLGISELMRKKGIIQDGDMKLDV
ncbi:MAG: PTS sugar transporter subunit IIC [Lachnospiraceae bacterium]|nr:PTS sugar transporter subunit IIC [Lachnospiraceae bacterium]